VSVEALNEGLAAGQEQVRHDRIDTVVGSTSLPSMYELQAEHDFTSAPVAIEPGSPQTLLASLRK
jgi:hypothetical protein